MRDATCTGAQRTARRTMRAAVALVLVTCGCGLQGCNGLPAGPRFGDACIEGTVTDRYGRPVSGVAVAVDYHLEGVSFAPLMPECEAALAGKPTVPSDFKQLAVDDEIRLIRIVDYQRRHVATLCAPCPERVVPRWDGLDVRGQPAPPGLYYMRAVADIDGELQLFEQSLFVKYCEPERLFRSAVAATDTDGRFRIPTGLVPIGERLTIADAEGNTEETTIANRVTLYALEPSGGDFRRTAQDVVVRRRRLSTRAELQLP